MPVTPKTALGDANATLVERLILSQDEGDGHLREGREQEAGFFHLCDRYCELDRRPGPRHAGCVFDAGVHTRKCGDWPSGESFSNGAQEL